MQSIAVRLSVAAAALACIAGLAGAQPGPVPLTGAKPYATLLCKYSDFPDLEAASRQHFDQIMASPDYPSVVHYWNEVGNGQFSLEGSRVYGWFMLPRASSHYVGAAGINLHDLHDDCIAAADSAVYFPDYYGINIVVNGSLDGTLTVGSVVMDRDGIQRSYVTTYLDAAIATGFGLAAHEIGHNFGLGHTSGPYGGTYDSKWDVMSAAAWVPVPGTDMFGPAHPNAYQKHYLGLFPAARILTAPIGTTVAVLERHAIPANNENPLMIVVPIPGPSTAFSPVAYYTLELRGGPGAGYDSAFPDPVVVIHYVHPLRGITVVDVDNNGDANDEGAAWREGEVFVDRANDISISFDEQVGTTMRLTVRVGERDVIAVSPPSRRRELAFGDTASRADSTAVIATGPTGNTLAWRASAEGLARRLTTQTSSGVGDGMLRFSVHPAQLAPGTYVDTITVNADAAVNRSVHLVDTLVIAAAPSLVLGLFPANRIDSLLTGQTRTLAAAVRTTGPGADTATWTATKSAAWIELLNGGAGSGANGALQWKHDAATQAPGTYVDTITVTLSNGATARLVDTLRVLPRPTLSLDRGFGSLTMAQQSAPRLDSVFVTVTGEWSAGAALASLGVVSPTVFLSGDPQLPAGGGWFRIRRNPGALAPGTYVNRLRIGLAMDATQYIEYEDTLHVQAAATRLLVSAASRRDTIVPGASSSDSVMVLPEGANALSLKWESRAEFSKTLLLPRNGSLPYGSGTGHQWLAWARNTAGDGPGVYVDTIWVRFSTIAADSARIIDTLVIRSPPALVVNGTSRLRTTIAGATAAMPDSASIGVDAGVSWSAASRRAWTTLATGSGTGPGMLRWLRDPAGLAAGDHVDTITVTASGLAGSPHRIVDTLRVWPALVIQSDSVRPAGIMGAVYNDTLRAEGASGTHGWSVASGELPPGLTMNAASGMLGGIPAQRGTFRFVARVTSDTFFVERPFIVTIGVPQLAAQSVLDELLGGSALDADQKRFLDLQGNANGRLDIGDVRAWLMSQESLARAGRVAPDSAEARLRGLTGVRP